MRPITRRLGAAVAVGLAGIWLLAAPAAAAYPQDPPNDPGYASAENDPTCSQSYVGSEQYFLYSFMPRCAPGATDHDGAAGMSVDRAWARYSTGSPQTVIAYVEGGINWHRDQPELADKVYINPGELPKPLCDKPVPAGATCDPSQYDSNHDGVFNAADYRYDSRVTDSNQNGWTDPEDLIAAFSCWDRATGSLGTLTRPDPSSPIRYDCSNGAQATDNDGNGYPHDISGWDFYDHQNDPATTDSQYGHANGQQKRAAAQTDNGIGEAGVCPSCLLLPVKAGAEALDRTDDLAQAWLFAADSGASVIVSVTADLGYSSFMHQAVENIWRRGVVMVQASNDFDSTDHQGGMWWPFVLPGNGLVPNTDDLDKASGPATLAANAGITTYRDRSDYTSWGTHNMFSAPNEGGTTSESTPTLGGVMALVLADGRRLNPMLNGPEAVQLVRATASPINDSNSPGLNWPGTAGTTDAWNLQYGYGRPNVYAAMQDVAAANIPPVGWIDSPDWFSLHDPTAARYVPITGHVEARRSSGYEWSLQYALGPEPRDGDWHTISTGAGRQAFDGTLGRLDLSRIPQSFWAAPYQLSKTKTLETTEQYTVTLRLQVTDAQGRIGVDRRTIDVEHDPSWLPGFPLHLGHGGDSQPALADLQGSGRLDIVFADSDGAVHAIDPVTGLELPGWPASTAPVVVQKGHAGIRPGHEPVFSPVAIGDLDHDGSLWVVTTSAEGRVYVFDSHGRLRSGWPQTMAAGVVLPAIPRPAEPMTRLPHQGAADSPVLDDLAGDGTLQIVQSGWDGCIHVWKPDGTSVRSIAVGQPQATTDPGMMWIQDHKLESAPVVANLDGSGRDLVIRSQWIEATAPDLSPGGYQFLQAFNSAGSLIWTAKMPSLIEYYGSAQEFVTEGINDPAAADVFGEGRDDIASGTLFSPSYLFHSDGTQAGIYGPLPAETAGWLQGNIDPAAIKAGNLPTDAPVGFTTSGAFGLINGVLSYVQPGTGAATLAGALLVPGSGLGINEYERAWTAAGGASQPGFPAQMQGLDFLGTPVIADVTGDGAQDIVQGADSSALMAYATGGQQAPGFPKFTTGWSVWAPAIGDLSTTGHNDVVELTREGYVFAWRTPGQASADSQWWTYRHDEHRTNRYGVDTRPPGALRDSQAGSSQVTFTDPGDNWYTGTADHLLVTVDGVQHTQPVRGPAGTRDSVAVPAAARSITIQAVDAAGNLGLPLTLRLDRSGTVPRSVAPAAPRAAARAASSPNDSPRPAAALIALAGVAGLLAAMALLWRRRATN